ncbi:MAG: hypothetical protein ACLGGX_03220 [Bdellovibrionia bacterium]
MKIIKLILILGFLTSCNSEPLEVYSELNSLRILDIAVNTPEVNTFDSPVTVNIQPLISDVNGGVASVDVTVDFCLDPGVSFGAEAKCDGSNATTQSFTPNAATLRTGVGPLFARSLVFPSAVFNLANDAARFNGLAGLVTVTAVRGAETIKAFRRVLFSEKTSGLNNNPSATDVLVNSGAWAVPTAVATVLAQITPGSAESYQFKTENGDIRNLTEKLDVSWFASKGTFKYTRTDGDQNNEWTPESGSGVLVIVVRDGRGGSSHVIKSW